MPELQSNRQTDVISLFKRTFGHEPRIVTSAPGRVNLIGEHTDYNGGQVLPIAIAHRTWVALADSPSATRSRAVSANASAIGEWDPASPQRSGEWWDYVAGVTKALVDAGGAPRALDIAVVSDVPSGAGLSSSAALEVATAIGAAELAGPRMQLQDTALLSHRAETEFVGVASGMMDQMASALASRHCAMHLHCDTGRIEHVPMRDAVLIFDTGVPRALRTSEYNTRRAECAEAFELLRLRNPGLSWLAHASLDEIRAAKLPAPLGRRALHVAEETLRVEQTVGVLRETGMLRGDLMFQSHESLRELYECSTPELDWFVDRASRATGVRGARLTGAGWGGCAIAVGEDNALTELAASCTNDYQARFGFVPRTWITRAETGPRIEGRLLIGLE